MGVKEGWRELGPRYGWTGEVCADEPGDVLSFVRGRLGWEPDEKQRLVLESGAARGILNCCRQWGKSTVTAALAVWEAWRDPKAMVLVVSPSARQSEELLRKARAFAERLGVGKGSRTEIWFPGGGRIQAVPGREETVRGFSAVTLLLIDEAARVPEELYKTVLPMLTVSQGRMWMMSTPFGRRGFFWEEWRKERAGWLKVTAPGWECERIPEAFLEEMKETQGEQWYRQEYGCEFVEAEGSWFEGEWKEDLYVEDVARWR